MTDQPLFDVQRNAFLALQRLVRERAAGEAAITETYRTATEDADREVQKLRRVVAASRKRATDEVDAAKAVETADTAGRFEGQIAGVETAFTEARAKAEQQYRIAEAKLRNEYKDRLWTIDSMHEAAEKEAEDEKVLRLRQASDADKQVATLWTEAEAKLEPFNLTREDVEARGKKQPSAVTLDDPTAELEEGLEEAEFAAEKLSQGTLPRLVGLWGTVWCVFVAGGLAAAAAAVAGLHVQYILGIGLGGAIVGGLLLRQILWLFARRQIRDRGKALAVSLTQATRVVVRLRDYAVLRHADLVGEATRQQESQRKQCDDLFLPKIAAVARQGKEVGARLENERSAKLGAVASSRTKAEREARMHFAQQGHAITDTHDAQLKEAEERFTSKLAEAESIRKAAWQELADAWFAGLAETSATCQALAATAEQTFPAWAKVVEGSLPLATAVPHGIRFGDYAVDPLALPDGTPTHPALMPTSSWQSAVPAFLPFPDRAAVLFKARDEGRVATVAALQAIMLRYLTGLPPGKVRLTIIDPVGLGENFAAFMHLADYDDLAITSRIWTEPAHIEARLLDLTEHMETVIQKYLRNQYKSIEDYNRAAGEVAEPYRVLVIANFPTNFTPEAARRLIAIMSSGPACGVCTLLGVDTAAGMPRDFRIADLDQVAFQLVWKEGKFTPSDPALAPFPLAMDAPPASADVAAIVKRIGEAGRLTKRVEVPFDNVSPTPDRIWKGSTKDGFEVAVGRAGATRKQMFMLGKGTAQHALIAGKTGSGKSTLLHAMITNLALTYSPDEAELYLIDFKKGVEFKMYAEQALPHARVVAIESEREFGISVLQRLDVILKERGDLYRLAGTNDVASYREARPTERFPRILLVVDEFQEFFVEDDKLSQEAALLLDRLVRQGRAFGVHILLGSQTLGGAFSLARSTIDQMAVRVALQCSEADAQLILSKDNSAARLLSRPGDAIYNDANGQIQGNNPFQVVWLSDERREEILADLRVRAAGRNDPKQLVFEGNATADIAECPGIRKLFDAPTTTGPITVWLGDAVAIKDPTTVVFRPQSGSNLLLLGQHEEAAISIQAAALAALVARLRPTADGPRSIAVIDGTPDDSETADVLRKVVAALGIPGAIVERFDLPAAIGEFAMEVDRRTKGEVTDRQPRFLFVHGLQRLRELRKADEDFGYGRRGEKTVSPGEQFLAILRDGPSVGIHTILWCDSVTNLTRAVDRQSLREFTLRVLFQMSANDSSQMMDTPTASRLGRNRALFLEEGLERPEKFRPYGLPGYEWLRGLSAI